MGRDIHYGSIALDILKIVGGGAVVASMLVAPNMGILLAPILRSDPARLRREYGQWQLQRGIERLRKRRYVEYEQRGNETYIVITESGRKKLRKFEFDALRLPEKPRRWDKKWRVVIFDIPENKKKERRIFSDRLKDLGLFGLQKSVFAYPYPCEDEIDFLVQFLDINRHVCFFETSSLGNGEVAIRRHFRVW
ncbi:MAG: CRISPR-associated endonuclease Cas2 [Candidatus Sungbacteria bacterium]|nr:CRISPR-associated endonuclease Cas2 [Candidatus Sungbacteria bacterium]